MQPFSIGIKVVLNGFVGDLNTVLEGTGYVPGVAFHRKECDVAIIVLMIEHGVGYFVQQQC